MAGSVSSESAGMRWLKSRWMWLLVVVAILVVSLLSLAGINLHTSIPAAPTGWTLRFGDDFNGPKGSLPSRSNWRFDLGESYPGGPAHWGTLEVESYTADPANISLDGQGHLLITPRRDKLGNWTSARIETNRDDFTAPVSGVLRMEARIQIPNVSGDAAQGYWPAFWTLGAPYRHGVEWPQMGEFDIMESVNGLNTVWGTLHCGIYPLGPCHEPRGIAAKLTCLGTGGCQAAFHVYAFEWDRSVAPAQLRWYVDGQILNRVTQGELPPDTWDDMTGHGGYFILLDVAMGGGFANTLAGGLTPTPGTEPGHPMVVDYVAVWTRAGGAQQPFSASSTR